MPPLFHIQMQKAKRRESHVDDADQEVKHESEGEDALPEGEDEGRLALAQFSMRDFLTSSLDSTRSKERRGSEMQSRLNLRAHYANASASDCDSTDALTDDEYEQRYGHRRSLIDPRPPPQAQTVHTEMQPRYAGFRQRYGSMVASIPHGEHGLPVDDVDGGEERQDLIERYVDQSELKESQLNGDTIAPATKVRDLSMRHSASQGSMMPSSLSQGLTTQDSSMHDSSMLEPNESASQRDGRMVDEAPQRSQATNHSPKRHRKSSHKSRLVTHRSRAVRSSPPSKRMTMRQVVELLQKQQAQLATEARLKTQSLSVPETVAESTSVPESTSKPTAELTAVILETTNLQNAVASLAPVEATVTAAALEPMPAVESSAAFASSVDDTAHAPSIDASAATYDDDTESIGPVFERSGVHFTTLEVEYSVPLTVDPNDGLPQPHSRPQSQQMARSISPIRTTNELKSDSPVKALSARRSNSPLRPHAPSEPRPRSVAANRPRSRLNRPQTIESQSTAVSRPQTVESARPVSSEQKLPGPIAIASQPSPPSFAPVSAPVDPAPPASVPTQPAPPTTTSTAQSVRISSKPVSAQTRQARAAALFLASSCSAQLNQR